MIGGWRSRAMCAVALVPSLALGQRGAGSPMGIGGGRSGGISRDPGIAIPKLVNAVNLLVEHRQDLALTDTQFMRIIAVKRALDSTNAPLMRRIDSVQRLFKGGSLVFGSQNRAHRDSLAEARATILETQAAIRENISESRETALGLLSSTQLPKVHEIEDKAQRAFADESKERGRGG